MQDGGVGEIFAVHGESGRAHRGRQRRKLLDDVLDQMSHRCAVRQLDLESIDANLFPMRREEARPNDHAEAPVMRET